MKTRKSIIWLLCAACVLFTSTVPAFAVSNNSVNLDDSNSELTLETIQGRDGPMTIPVVVVTIPLQTYTTYALDDSCEYEQEVTYFVPATEDAVDYNETLVQQLRISGPGTVIESSLDKNQYITITTTIKYTIFPDSKNNVSDYMISMNSVAIDRDKDPEGYDGYLLGIGTPSVRIVQRGYSEYEPYYCEQEITKSVNWGPKGVSIPSDWRPILTTSYSGVYNCFADFRVTFIYRDEKNGAYSVENSFFRNLIK